MIELAVATLVLAAISDQEEGTGRPAAGGPMVATVPSSALAGHRWRSMHAEDHVPQVREERINTEVRRLQRLMTRHAEKIECLREERADPEIPREYARLPLRY